MPFAAFFAKIAWGALFSRAKSNAVNDWHAIPPKWKLGILVALALGVGFLVHQHVAHVKLKNQYNDGYAAAQKADQKIIDAARAEARQYKARLDATNIKITNEEHARYEDQANHNRAVADALRVRLNAAHQPGSRGGGHLPGVPAAGGPAGRPQPAADAGLAAGPAPATVCVDAAKLIDYAEQADDDHDARVTIEDQHDRIEQTWPKAGDKKP